MDALLSAVSLGRELGVESAQTARYAAQGRALARAIDAHFGGEVGGYDTYRYYAGNTLLRSWICMPLIVGLVVDHKKMRADCIELFKKLGLDLDPDAKMGDLTVAKMQMVEIAKALARDVKLLLLDEPTAALTEAEVDILLDLVDKLRQSP